MRKFRFKIDLSITQNWIDDGANAESIRERLTEFLQEELNGYAHEGEYVANVSYSERRAQ